MAPARPRGVEFAATILHVPVCDNFDSTETPVESNDPERELKSAEELCAL